MDTAEQKFVSDFLSESTGAIQSFSSDELARRALFDFSHAITSAFRNGNKILLAGNGGSAGDAQHIAGEFISRLFFDRAPLPAIALTTDTSVITAVGNDYGYEKVFERQVLGLGNRGDVFLGISTSGNSPNVLRAFEAARSRGMVTLGFTGSSKNQMESLCDLLLRAPSKETAVIQQVHIVAAHLICGLVESQLFGDLRKTVAAE